MMNVWKRFLFCGLFSLALLLMGGCGFLAGPEEPEATPTPDVRALVPTFTPTPVQPPTPTPEPPTPTPEPVQAEPTSEPAPAEPAPEATDTPTPEAASLTVTETVVNVRRGPGTNYGIVGSVNQGMQFDVLARNPAGDWYQFCCVNGEEGWIYAELVAVDNAQQIALAEDVPPPPPTNTPAPAPPTNTPAPQPPEAQPEPQPQPASDDPCANIGGDGCKFRLTGGPKFAPNGGLELKLQLLFIHSGVEGGQAQGSYFIWLEKDGQKLPVSDSVRSVALQKNDGPQGQYNYEYKIGAGDLPGGTVAGTYTGWVLDGNGERDSQTFSFTVPEGQGEVWIQFDQG